MDDPSISISIYQIEGQNAVEEMKSHDRDEAKSLGYTYYQDLVTE